MKIPKYYTTFQASRLLGVSLPTVVNYIKSGILKAHKTPGGHRRIAETNLIGFADQYNMPLTPELMGHQGPKRILWVDDDQDFLELGCEVLSAEPTWEIRAAESGFQAGMAVVDWKPDLVILDIEMPNMNGFAALAELRKEGGVHTNTPVFACTALHGNEIEEKVRDAGFEAYISKPVDFPELLIRIKNEVGQTD